MVDHNKWKVIQDNKICDPRELPQHSLVKHTILMSSSFEFLGNQTQTNNQCSVKIAADEPESILIRIQQGFHAFLQFTCVSDLINKF